LTPEHDGSPTVEEIVRHDDFDPDAIEWVGEPRRVPLVVVGPDPSWPAQFERLAARIRRGLGDQVLAVEHVGSTSVRDLPAKPIIDIDVIVAEPANESTYVPALAQVGFSLQLREPRWHEHRLLVATKPAANVHVFGPDSPEPIRHRMFRDWLREHPEDRARYAEAKRMSADASNAGSGEVIDYNLRKQPVVRDILDRMFRAHGMLPPAAE
jgi:GrpB-like predicted nucleotidyltransferase (UPF0157 family)